MKSFLRKILPKFVVRRIQVYLHGISAADAHEAWRFKRKFFWEAVRVLDFNKIDGDYVEFGCHTAMTFRLAYDQFSGRNNFRHMWAFDSFEGLPAASSDLDKHPVWLKGAMSTSLDAFINTCREHGIKRDQFTTVKGYYEETLMNSGNVPNNIAFVYIDCDMYSSTKTVLEFLSPRLKHGMIIAFDDYFCMSDDNISGERRAFIDVFSRLENWKFVRYRDFGWAGASFIVESSDFKISNQMFGT